MPITRCTWCGQDPLYVSYHDNEWGVPEHDDDKLFEKLILDGAQAGLSWITILRKREGYRRAFDDFDATKIARYRETDVARLMNDAGIVRNRQKIQSAITNAQAYLKLREEFGSFDRFLWSFVDGRTIQNRRMQSEAAPVKTSQSEAMSKALIAKGFRFVGPTIIYAFMQAVGMVNDHAIECFRHAECSRL